MEESRYRFLRCVQRPNRPTMNSALGNLPVLPGNLATSLSARGGPVIQVTVKKVVAPAPFRNPPPGAEHPGTERDPHSRIFFFFSISKTTATPNTCYRGSQRKTNQLPNTGLGKFLHTKIMRSLFWTSLAFLSSSKHKMTRRMRSHDPQCPILFVVVTTCPLPGMNKAILKNFSTPEMKTLSCDICPTAVIPWSGHVCVKVFWCTLPDVSKILYHLNVLFCFAPADVKVLQTIMKHLSKNYVSM